MRKLATATVAALAATFAASAFAANDTTLERSVALKDGSTVHVFRDGKMGMEDRLGRPFLMPSGHVMEARDGSTIEMKGNEVWRVYDLYQDYRGS